jgi:anti-anti-sigma regulatory factor
MILISLQPVVRDVFEIAGLARLFFIEKSLEDALPAMKFRP